MSGPSRRGFLKASAAGLAALVTGGFHPNETRGAGAESRRRFQYSKCNETFRGWPQEKIFRCIARLGYTGVEIAPFTIANDVAHVSARRRAELRRQAEDAGIQIVGLHWLLSRTKGLHLTSPDPAVRRKTTGYLCKLAEFCSDLGGSVLVFGSPKQRNLLPGIGREQGMRYAAEVLRGVLPTLARLDVVLALEPLSPRTTNFLTTAAEAAELVDRVEDRGCKLILDCNAMASESAPIPQLIRKYRSQLVHFHANDPNGRGPGMGKLDFVPIFEALRDIRYGGWISVEVFDYSPGCETLARKSIEYLKKVEAQLG